MALLWWALSYCHKQHIILHRSQRWVYSPPRLHTALTPVTPVIPSGWSAPSQLNYASYHQPHPLGSVLPLLVLQFPTPKINQNINLWFFHFANVHETRAHAAHTMRINETRQMKVFRNDLKTGRDHLRNYIRQAIRRKKRWKSLKRWQMAVQRKLQKQYIFAIFSNMVRQFKKKSLIHRKGPLTSFLDRRAQSSSVSAASYFPWRRYSAPRFFRVVVTVGESTLAALCQPPYSPYGTFSLLRCLFSSRSSATCQIGLLSPAGVKWKQSKNGWINGIIINLQFLLTYQTD